MTTATKDQLRNTVVSTLDEVIPGVDAASVDPEHDLREELDIDSMDFLNFVIGLSEATGIEIPERDYPQLATLAGCIDYLAAHAS